MFSRRRGVFLALCCALVLAGAGCGNKSAEKADTTAATTADTPAAAPAVQEAEQEQVPADAVALVGDTPIPKSTFDRLMTQAEKSFELREQEFPKTGTPEFQQIVQDAVSFLVRRAEFAEEAETFGIVVAETDVSARLEQLKQQYFGGDDKKYQAEIEKAGLTEETVLEELHAQLIAERLFDRVTQDVTISDEEVQTYYDGHEGEFTQPESRPVRHILVKTKKKADELLAQLEDGADFAKLAKESSLDESSKDGGGEYLAVKGQSVPEFDKVAFELGTGELSQPVKSVYGWHIIEALADAEAATTTPFEQVKESIRAQLLQEKQNKTMVDWVAALPTKYADKVAYTVGYAPPPTPSADATTGDAGGSADTTGGASPDTATP